MLSILTMLEAEVGCAGTVGHQKHSILNTAKPNTNIQSWTERAKKQELNGVVFDLLFCSAYLADDSNISPQTELASSISKTHSREDLLILCKSASDGQLTLPIPGIGDEIKNFQSACRYFGLVQHGPALSTTSAIAQLDRCESIFNALKAEVAVAAVQEKAADLYLFRLSQNYTAEQKYEAALAVYSRYGFNTALARIYENLAYSYQVQGIFDAAEAAYAEAGSKFSAADRYDKAPECYLEAAQCLVLLGEKHLASARTTQALNLARRKYVQGGDSTALIKVLMSAADVFFQIGNADDQLVVLREAVKRVDSNDERLRVLILRELASVLEDQGKQEESQRIQTDVDRILSKMIADLQKEIVKLRQSRRQEHTRIGTSLSLLGWAYEQKGLIEMAAQTHADAAEAWEKAAEYRKAIDALVVERNCLLRLPTYNTASLPPTLIADKAEEWSEWDIACTELLALAGKPEQDTRAINDYYERAIRDGRKGSDMTALYDALIQSSRFLLDQNDSGRAIPLLREAIEISKEIPTDLSSLSSLYLLAVKAENDLKLNQSLLEEWAERAISLSNMQAAISQDTKDDQVIVELISRLIDAETKAGRKANVLDYIARLRSMPRLRKPCLTALDNHPELQVQDSDSNGEIASNEVATGRAQVLKWLAETSAFIGKSRLSGGLDFRYTLKQVECLPESAVYLQYIITHTGVYAFVARQSDMSIIYVGSRAFLDELLSDFRQDVLLAQASIESGLPLKDPSLSGTEKSDPMVHTLSRLHSMLINPVLTMIAGSSSLVVGLPQEMSFIPVHALLSEENEKYVLDDFAVSYLRPTTTLAFKTDSRIWSATEPILIFAAESEIIPSVESEISGIVSSFQSSRCVRGTDVSRGFSKLAGDARCIHISAHYSPGTNSAIRFANEGVPVSLDDIYALRTPSLELVTLSCCESAGGVQAHLDSAISLVDAFSLAGTHTVAATLWRVSDKASAAFAENFYSGLASGDSKVDALRSAQLTLREMPGMKHPFYWSAFALFGDPI